MAFTITVTPHNFGDLKANLVEATFDAANSSHEISASVSALGLARLIAFVPALEGTVSGSASELSLSYNRSTSKIRVVAMSSGAQIGPIDTLVAGTKMYALAIGV